MSNLEKLVVLTVVFLSAVVLAVSFNEDGAAQEVDGPQESSARHGDDAGTPPRQETPRERPSSPGAERGAPGRGEGLLSAELGGERPTPRRAPAGSVPEVEADPRRILKAERGLRPSELEDYMVYRCVSGDTWSGLSQRFYGSSRFTHHLRAANEGLDQLRIDEEILVPVVDFTYDAGSREPHRPQERRPKVAESSTPAQAPPAMPAPGGTYVVVDGDNLSTISQKVYGTARRWEEIYQANKGVLDDPDWLKVGTKLKIPR